MRPQSVVIQKIASTNVIHRLSKIFQPINVVQKDSQANLDITSKSQRLMLELGVIRQANPGCFHFLPIGVRALDKLTRLVDNELFKIGAQKLMFPTLTNAKLWKTTGRLEEIGSELFTLNDRHGSQYILSPTHEECASDLLSSIFPISYKQFPLKLYQITSKYRDEMKPRFGLIRGRQFIMKDLYSFDINTESALKTYEEVCDCYDKIFTQIGVKFAKVLGESGEMGGSLSHEYHYNAAIGEDRILLCSNCNYSANVKLAGDQKCANCGSSEHFNVVPGIEVGHTFLLGEKYSKPLGAKYLAENQKSVNLQMGSYGLGLSRILAAGIEVLSNENEIRWPKVLAPYTVAIIIPKKGSKEEKNCTVSYENLNNELELIPKLEGNVLVDDRSHMTIGRRMLDAKRIGYPYIIVIGKGATQESPLYELNDLEENTQMFLSQNDLLTYLSNKINV